ncbi:MAG TPA: type 1 glutamine amidotransferase domain-containing protein [bacterium]|nr:type 1 glutamine amidotransferase domain-containing protein [bacterium]HMW33862.1 type 1 glutamine amidotransferase domain-containing protein [bacterium]HMW36215.1 type 1 glutamine amidotransferase domain-containing protein [bacterium]HMY36381.1 type 1 glutamine amidotransferase domain-containing protein [bacterium]HMZ05451.1 type 1 glutamine amidotransferase domain-containing protein [bacterium]
MKVFWIAVLINTVCVFGQHDPNTSSPKKLILMVAANSSVSAQTGWPIGVWAAEITHPYLAFIEAGYEVEIVSPNGGKIEFDNYSDPRDPSGYSAHDMISMGFIHTPSHMALLEKTRRLDEINEKNYDAIFVCGGQSPMYTFIDNTKLHTLFAKFYESGKPSAAICHGTCILLKAKLSNGQYLIEGKTWTGFANSEEDFADKAVGKKIQPFRIESEAGKMNNTNFITHNAFRPFAIRDGHLITGQQQNSGTEAAKLVIEMLGY